MILQPLGPLQHVQPLQNDEVLFYMLCHMACDADKVALLTSISLHSIKLIGVVHSAVCAVVKVQNCQQLIKSFQ
jgi:hypothetical protein